MEYKKYSLILVIALIILIVLFIGHNTNKTVELTPEVQQKYDSSINKADEYAFFGEDKKEIDELQQALQVKPKDIKALYSLSSAQHNAKQYEQAEETYKKLEPYEKDKANYWYLRAANINNIPNNIENIKLAAKYIEICNKIAGPREKAPIELELEAKIYLEEYKYYKKLQNNKESTAKLEGVAAAKFLHVIDEFKNNTYTKEDRDWISIREDLYNQYLFYPNGNYRSPYDDAPELEPVELTPNEYEQWQKFKNNMPKKD